MEPEERERVPRNDEGEEQNQENCAATSQPKSQRHDQGKIVQSQNEPKILRKNIEAESLSNSSQEHNSSQEDSSPIESSHTSRLGEKRIRSADGSESSESQGSDGKKEDSSKRPRRFE
ncbi:hypothetical protein FGO68_gene15987 [Halteria grandinella]|uniref:Uncharacterized protein n=1 Tax=Halteria grandinella TaxID=5974 RepID=A0A8J8P4M8_HALGN|nr:hypothetical protein FGO68_gene15987 [Halteria grandinella]